MATSLGCFIFASNPHILLAHPPKWNDSFISKTKYSLRCTGNIFFKSCLQMHTSNILTKMSEKLVYPSRQSTEDQEWLVSALQSWPTSLKNSPRVKWPSHSHYFEEAAYQTSVLVHPEALYIIQTVCMLQGTTVSQRKLNNAAKEQ